ncbi:MAG TPA: hypothetical protein DCY79_07765 [Planctomycetaceae bacterium]|nr:hypothetical protein [Planctomycetaceae bacterium]
MNMRFSNQELAAATHLKRSGLTWEPAVGNYVYDAGGLVKPSSPFQPGVYFLLNYDCFMQRVGGLAQFKAIMTWLPTWHDARSLLSAFGIGAAEIQHRLEQTNALEQGTELLELYRLLANCLHEPTPTAALRGIGEIS